MSAQNEDRTASKDWLEIVRERVATIRFGSVQITVHDGRVTQVEAIEKTRISSDSTPQPLHGSPKSREKP